MAAALLPHPQKADRGGEDAVFLGDDSLSFGERTCPAADSTASGKQSSLPARPPLAGATSLHMPLWQLCGMLGLRRNPS